MPRQPEGIPAPADGLLPAQVIEGAAERELGLYLHVPYCRVRCGYCDFNTYTASELGPGASRDDYAGSVRTELALAARALGDSGLPERAVSTVFIGGGTPTLLPAATLAEVLSSAAEHLPFAADVEISVEANPDTIDGAYAATLAAAGVTRLSVGMQSSVPQVLRALDRDHRPEAVPVAVRAAREAGLQVSLDLIYGAPGESLADWRRSLDTVLGLEPDHVSAYGLIIEPGTRLGRQVARGEVPGPDDDLQAEKYELAAALLREADYGWYEVSNWARRPAARSRHNQLYWRNQDWWGIGPGAHSHIGGVRWWNVKHPRAWADRLGSAASPAQAREILTREERALEEVMLRVRTAEGIPAALLAPQAIAQAPGLAAEGLIEAEALGEGRIVITDRARLLVDTVVRRLV